MLKIKTKKSSSFCSFECWKILIVARRAQEQSVLHSASLAGEWPAGTWEQEHENLLNLVVSVVFLNKFILFSDRFLFFVFVQF